ncbi:MAG TPA: ATP-binding cassette domain-containing protein [Polyangiaceae bacterium]|jgi:osmoprotectant transport system ATP-binding protein|nr:ATP-binding cassette domain-containing protein [Polyangiaceae bacterium]
MPAPILQLIAAGVRFGATVALAPTDLAVQSARTTVLLGPSGCGKTTALRLMLGLLRPDTGQVLFEQLPLTRERLLEVRAHMGYVVQDGGLFPHLTARGNVELMARHLGWSERRTKERVTELAQLVRLPEVTLLRHPSQISGGQKQRVALMRALMLDPHLLLLDEPLGALDPLVRSDLQDDLARIFERLGKSVVLVTHDLAEAEYFGHEIVLLRDGHVVQRGSFDDLTNHPADPFVTRFVSAQRRLGARASSEPSG